MLFCITPFCCLPVLYGCSTLLTKHYLYSHAHLVRGTHCTTLFQLYLRHTAKDRAALLRFGSFRLDANPDVTVPPSRFRYARLTDVFNAEAFISTFSTPQQHASPFLKPYTRQPTFLLPRLPFRLTYTWEKDFSALLLLEPHRYNALFTLVPYAVPLLISSRMMLYHLFTQLVHTQFVELVGVPHGYSLLIIANCSCSLYLFWFFLVIPSGLH